MSISFTCSTAQAADIFLSFPDSDIVGESVAMNHVDEVQVESFSWNLLTEAGKKSTTNVDISEFSLIKFADSSTASILTKAVMGVNLGRVVVKIHRATEGMHLDYLVLTLNDATIASVASDIDGGQDRVVERVIFTFSSVTGVYTVINRDGSPGEIHEYNIAAANVIL